MPDEIAAFLRIHFSVTIHHATTPIKQDAAHTIIIEIRSKQIAVVSVDDERFRLIDLIAAVPMLPRIRPSSADPSHVTRWQLERMITTRNNVIRAWSAW